MVDLLNANLEEEKESGLVCRTCPPLSDLGVEEIQNNARLRKVLCVSHPLLVDTLPPLRGIHRINTKLSSYTLLFAEGRLSLR